MIEWIKHATWTPPFPDDKDPHAARVLNFGGSALIMGMIGHAGYAAFFLLLGMGWPVVLNVVSVISYILLRRMSRNGWLHTSLFLTLLEMNTFVVISVRLVGWESGFQLWLAMQPLVVFVGYRWRTWFKFVLIGLAAAQFVALHVLVRPLTPYYHVPPEYLTIIFYFNLATILGSFVTVLFLLHRTTEGAEAAYAEEHARTRSLLLNILPEPIADRLTRDRGVIADDFSSASILFADLVGFTRMSGKMPAGETVQILNEIFYDFDTIVETLGLEKIKTIGDGYMIAAGIPERTDDHAARMLDCAVKMIQAIRDFNARTGRDIRLRIGINSGHVVAGVIGKNKFTYDLWGDTVNVASRMESHGAPGKIHVSQDTYRLVKDLVRVTPRGEIEVKGKGAMETYFVDALSRKVVS